MIAGRINIKPLSVNRAWQGKRFKTPEYKQYERDCLLLLKNRNEKIEGSLGILLIFGVSSTLADTDNPVKPFVDILQKKYGFNDNRIYTQIVRKVDVPKGLEFIEFRLLKLDELNSMAPEYLQKDPTEPDWPWFTS